MIRTFCDICGKELKEDHSDQVNVVFHAYGFAGFIVKLKAHTFKDGEINLCVDCADSVVSVIEDLKLMRGVRMTYESRVFAAGEGEDRSEKP